MKNLKKVLALVLAFACAFTMFAGAAFSDQADIKSAKAVDMLSALGIIKGYSDGSYKPDKVVTRAEMAKMIYVIRNGGSDVVTQYEGTTVPFTDVQNVNHWAKGYIAYCYYNGIIAGKSATKFDPDAPVTGQEAAKMALVLLGYDANRAGLVGKAWAVKTNNLASQKDLYKDYGSSVTAGAPRQFAAQLLYNTLWAGTVRWSEDAQAYQDVVENVLSGDGVTAKPLIVTVAKKYMGLEEQIGTFNGDSKINDGLKATETKVGGATITFVPENGNAWIGEAVKVLYKESKDGNSGLDRHDTIYGMTLSGDTSVVNGVKGDVDKDQKDAKIKVGDTKYDVYDNSVDVIVNYNVDGKKSMSAEAFNKAYGKASADAIKFIQNDNGKITAAYVTDTKFTKVTSLTDKKISLAGIGSLDINDDLELDKNVAKDDIVALTTMYADKHDDDKAYNVVAKADVVKDVKVTNVKGADGEQKVMIDGKYVEVAALDTDHNKIMDSDYKTKVELNSTYDFVMHGNYWVAAKEVSASTKDIALLTNAGSKDDIKKQVEVMFSDGTKKIYEYDDDDKANDSFDTIRDKKGQIFSYTLVGDSKIQLKQSGANLTYVAAAKAATSGKVYDADRKTLFFDGSSRVVAKDAMAFVKFDGDYYTYNIDAIKSINAMQDDGKKKNVLSDIDYYTNGDNEVVAFMVTLANKPGATASSAQYGYITEALASTSVDGTKYQEITVWNGKEVVTLKVEASKLDGFEKGNAIKYNVGADGITDKADLKQITRGNAGAVQKYEEGKLLTLYVDKNNTKGDSSAYKIAKDCVVIGINTEDKKSAEGAAVQQAQFVKDSTIKVDDNILYVLNDDDEVVAIFADTNNKITDTMIASGDAYIAK